MAQSALAACLAYAQNLQHYRQDQTNRTGRRETKTPYQIQVLILGAGEMARACAQTLKQRL